MNQEWDGIERRKSLRAEAEAMVARFYPEHYAKHAPEKLLHELLVHKVELELQNEELRLAYAAMQDIRDRYLDLYEFAPVGYLTITPQGQIAEINLTGSGLLNLERSYLIKSQFSKLVAAADQLRWQQLFKKMLASATGTKQEIELTLKQADQASFCVRLECLRWETSAGEAMLRIALAKLNTLKFTA